MEKINFLEKAVKMLANIKIGNRGLFIDRYPDVKGYGIGFYRKALVIEIWEFTLFLIPDDAYFIDIL